MTVGFDFVDRRVMAAVAARRLQRPQPGRPVPRASTSPTRPRCSSRAGSRRRAPTSGSRRSRPRSGSTCSTPRCSPLRGSRAQPALRAPVRLPAGRRDPQARRARGSSGTCWTGEGVTAARRHDLLRPGRRRCAGAAAIKLARATRRRRSPSVRCKVADRLAASPARRPAGRPAGGDPAAAASRRPPTTPAGHDARRRPSRDALARRAPARVVLVAGPDAAGAAREALGAPVLVVDALRDLEQRDADRATRALTRPRWRARPLVFEGLDELDPAERGRLLRALDERRERVAGRGAVARRGARARRPHRACSSSAAADASPSARRPGRALDRRRPTRATSPRSSGSRCGQIARGRRGRADRGARRAATARPTPPTSTSARARRRVAASASSPPGSTPALPLGRPRRCPSASSSCCSRSRPTCATATACSRDWGYERPSPAPRASRCCSPASPGTGKTMAAQVLAAELGLELFRVDLATIVSQVHRGDREEPRPHLRRRRRLQRDPVLRRGRRAVRQALGGLGRPRPLREHRGRLPAAEDGGLRGRGHPRHELPAQHRRRVPAPPGLRRSTSRSPRPRTASASGGCCCPAEAPLADDVDLDFLADAVQALGRLDPQLLAGGRLPGRRRRRRRSACATSCAPSRSSTRKLGRLTLEADFESYHELIRPAGGAPRNGAG